MFEYYIVPKLVVVIKLVGITLVEVCILVMFVWFILFVTVGLLADIDIWFCTFAFVLSIWPLVDIGVWLLYVSASS